MTARHPRAVAAVTLGIFAIVTTEILPIGLLTPIADGFGVSPGVAGWTMTMPGFVAAVAAPVVTVATKRLDRRPMLAALMLLLALSGFLTAAAPAFWVLLVARFLVGLVIGGFWSIGSRPRAAARPREHRPRDVRDLRRRPARLGARRAARHARGATHAAGGRRSSCSPC